MKTVRKIMVTGGAGFIGSALIRHIIQNTQDHVLNVDKLTYAGNLQSVAMEAQDPRYHFCKADIADRAAMDAVIKSFQPDIIIHLAAESHVDRSIDSAGEFIHTNIIGTYVLLESVRHYWQHAPEEKKQRIRFHHVSTDEVFGDLDGSNALFDEETAYAPSSPYAASKASSDHLVCAWQRTYGLPVVITNCSNNYGPYHFPEKLIPHIILNALTGKSLPVYGDGKQVRDWLYVEDHARALYLVATEAQIGQSYNIGGHNERENIQVICAICDLLEEIAPERRLATINSYHDLITYVKDRPGHDRRYAINATKIQKDLGWRPQETFETGLRKTVQWYLNNKPWWQAVLDGSYKLERLGKGDERHDSE